MNRKRLKIGLVILVVAIIGYVIYSRERESIPEPVEPIKNAQEFNELVKDVEQNNKEIEELPESQ